MLIKLHTSENFRVTSCLKLLRGSSRTRENRTAHRIVVHLGCIVMIDRPVSETVLGACGREEEEYMEEKRERNRYRSQEEGSEGGTYKESKHRYRSIKRKMKTERKLF